MIKLTDLDIRNEKSIGIFGYKYSSVRDLKESRECYQYDSFCLDCNCIMILYSEL